MPRVRFFKKGILHMRGSIRTKGMIGLGGGAALLAGLLIWAPWGAGAAPGPSVQIGLQTVPKDYEASALDWVSGMECAGDSAFSEVTSAAATNGAGFATLEPEGSTILRAAQYGLFKPGAQSPEVTKSFISSDSAPVYAVFVSGACKGETEPLTGARVLVNEDGRGMQIQAWGPNDEKDVSQPFGAQFDQGFSASTGSES